MAQALGSPLPVARRTATSRTQDGLWYLDRVSPGAHLQALAWRVDGDLDAAALRDAWQDVLDRHEALRTTLTEDDGEPVQRIAQTGANPVVLDLHGIAEVDRAARADQLLVELAATPVDLATGPLASLTLISEGPGRHRLLLLAHRAVADRGSLATVVDELSRCYAARLRRRAATLPPVSLQYADHARWQLARTGSQELRELENWWRAALNPAPPPLSLPTDRVRPPLATFACGSVALDWTDSLGPALASFAREAGVPAEVVVLAAFQALLARQAREQRVAVACPVPVRPRAGFEHTVGPFTDLVVVCADLSAEPTFAEHVAAVAERHRAALAHRDLPFADVVRVAVTDRDPARVPLADAVFVAPGERAVLELPGATVRPVPVAPRTAVADLAVVLDSPTSGRLLHRSALYQPASAARLAEQLRTLLAAGVADPSCPVPRLPLETPEQIGRAVAEADEIDTGGPVEHPVAAQVRGWAARTPDAPAIAWQGEIVSYAELVGRADAITARLRALGVTPGDPVAVSLPSGPRLVAALLGVLDAGASLVCLGPADDGQRGQMVLTDLRPTCLVVDGAPGRGLPAWYRDELDGVLLDLAADGTASTASTAMPVPPAAVDLDARMYVAYTSGSTGTPKGIAQTHRGFAQFVAWLAGNFDVTPGSRVAQWAAPGYDASLCQMFTPLVAGATLCPVPGRVRIDPAKLVAWLADERVSMFETVPSFAREMLRALSRLATPLALRNLLLAGEALPGELVAGLRAALPSTRLHNLYGPTESILATWYEVTGPVKGTVPIGRSIPGRQVLVVDEQDRPCPAGIAGQIVIRSPYVAQGYVGAEKGNPEAFAPLRDAAANGIGDGPVYRTGDVGRVRLDGALEFSGREDAQIKFYGTRIELAEIETALAKHDSVRQCALATVRDDASLITRLVAFVVPNPDGAQPAADQLRTHLRRTLGSVVPPMTFEPVAELPRNLGGKIDVRRLPTGRVPAAATESAGPRSVTEQAMATIWADLLGTEHVPGDLTFFELGGHSLLVPRLLARIRDQLGVGITVAACLADPTLVGLSATVDGSLQEPTSNHEVRNDAR